MYAMPRARGISSRAYTVRLGDVLKDLSELRVLIAEDHALVRQGLSALVGTEVGDVLEVEDGDQALDLLKREHVDLALIDIGLPIRTGLDVLREVRKRELPVKIIILTGDTDRYAPKQIYADGADGFLYKTADAEHFLETFEAVARGRPVRTARDNEPTETSVAELRETLTDREAQILKLVVEGASTQAAASILSISDHTVRKHREHINAKLGTSSPAALAAFAIKSGLV